MSTLSASDSLATTTDAAIGVDSPSVSEGPKAISHTTFGVDIPSDSNTLGANRNTTTEPDAKGSHTHKTTGKAYNCPICGKVFKHNGDFKRHLLTHSLIKPFLCNDCGKQFAQKGNLMIHIRTHTGEKPFICKECGKRYVQKGHLNEHMRTHSGEKPFDCSVCLKKFSRKCDLCEHMRIHTGEKPYSCPLCGKQFAQKGNLTAHMRSHTGERPFNCTRCGKKFGDKSNLKKHVQKCSNRASYECPICKEHYLDLLEMNDHLKQHENKESNNCDIGSTVLLQLQLIEKLTQNKKNCLPYECPLCKEQFCDLLKMSSHLKQHASEATNNVEPTSQSYLKQHESRAIKDFEPPLLVQVQLLEKFRQNSSNRMPYECPLCKEQCFDMLEMRDHLKQHESKSRNDCELSLCDRMRHSENEATHEYDIEPSSLLEIQLGEQKELGDASPASKTTDNDTSDNDCADTFTEANEHVKDEVNIKSENVENDQFK